MLLTLSPYKVPGAQMLRKHWMDSYTPLETEDPHSLSQSVRLLCEVVHFFPGRWEMLWYLFVVACYVFSFPFPSIWLISSLLHHFSKCVLGILYVSGTLLLRWKGYKNQQHVYLELKCLLWEIKLDIHPNNYAVGLMCAMEDYFVKNHKPIPFPLVCNNHA